MAILRGVWFPDNDGQLFDVRAQRPDTGEARFAVAMLELAIHDLEDRDNPFRGEAARWVLGVADDAFPFTLVCDLVGADAAACRDKLAWRFPLPWLARQPVSAHRKAWQR